MARKHMKRQTKLLNTMKMQIKMQYHYTCIRMETKNMTIPIAGEGGERWWSRKVRHKPPPTHTQENNYSKYY